MPKSPFLAALLLVAVASTASAQQPPTVRIRGTIEAVDGAMLSIKSRDGADMKVRTTDNVAVFGVAKTDLSEIKSGSYIGVTAMPEPKSMSWLPSASMVISSAPAPCATDCAMRWVWP